jgi:hypothetical protein
MIYFKQGRSYLWLLPIFAVLFFGPALLLDNGVWGALTLPLFGAFLLVSEWRSGIALDSFMRATHLKDSWQYRALIAWQVTWLVLMSMLSVIMIRLWLK